MQECVTPLHLVYLLPCLLMALCNLLGHVLKSYPGRGDCFFGPAGQVVDQGQSASRPC